MRAIAPMRCSASVHNGGRAVSFHQCGNPGKRRFGGKPFCGIHDPAAIARRLKKTNAIYAERSARLDRANARAMIRNEKAEMFDDVRNALELCAVRPNFPSAAKRILIEAREIHARDQAL